MTHKSELHVTRKQLEAALQLVNKRYKLKSYREIDHGIVNLVYFLKNQNNQEFVLRIGNPIWESYKVRKEKTVYDIIRKKTKVPIPKILVADMSKKVMPYTFTIWKKIKGDNLANVLKKLSEKEKKKIFRQMGKYLAELHNIRFRSFGDFDTQKGKVKIVRLGDIHVNTPRGVATSGPFKTWKSMYKSFMAVALYRIKTHSQFKQYYPQIKKFFDKKINVLNQKIVPRLVYNDFGSHNVLVRNGNVVALLDFEWSYTGDSELDFATFIRRSKSRNKNQIPPEVEEFKKSYQKQITLSTNYEEKRKLYEVSDVVRSLIGFKWIHMRLSKKKKAEAYKRYCRRIEKLLKDNN